MRDQQTQTRQMLEQILHSVLGPHQQITPQTPLLGAIPEFDSSSIMTILTLLEDQFDIVFDDAELSAELFSSTASLYQFLLGKLNLASPN